MRLFSIAMLVGLSACVTTPNGIDLSSRTDSWRHAPTSDLVAVLGEPTSTRQDALTWQFPAPNNNPVGSSGSTSAYSGLLPSPLSQPCSNCVRSSRTSPPDLHVSSGGSSFPGTNSAPKISKPRFCTYIAYIDGETIAKLTTLSKPGTHCRFEKIPLRSN